MKNILILLLSILTISLASCDKDDDPQPQDPNTSVNDNTGNTGGTDGNTDTTDNTGGTIENPVINPTADTIYLIHPDDKYGSYPYTMWPSSNRDLEYEQSLLANDISPYSVVDHTIESVTVEFYNTNFTGNYGVNEPNVEIRPAFSGDDVDTWGWMSFSQRSVGGVTPFIDTFDVNITLTSGESYTTKLYVYHWSYNPNY